MRLIGVDDASGRYKFSWVEFRSGSEIDDVDGRRVSADCFVKDDAISLSLNF